MDIYWYGQACFKIKGKQTSLIIDPYDPEFVGLKLPKDLEADIALVTHPHKDHSRHQLVTGDPVLIEGPGEYDIKGVSITGILTFHDLTEGTDRGKNTVYNMNIDGVHVVHLGDLGHTLSQEQVEQIGNCDILMIPVGGTYTIDAKSAAEVISQLEPSIIIPMHYQISGLKFPLADLETFLKEMGKENIESQSKLIITKDKLPAEPGIIVLNKV